MPDFLGKLRQRNSISARALEFTILTAMRTGTVIAAKRSEIDLDRGLWTIPADSLKGKRGTGRKDHVVPLPPRVVDIVRDMPRDRLFVIGGRGHVSAA